MIIKNSNKFFLAVLLLLLSNGCSAQPVDDRTIVCKTRTGAKYHKSDCSYLSKSKIEISLKDAVAEGLTACSRCRPIEVEVKAEGKAKQKKVYAYRCQAITKKGTQCKRKASAGSNYCWQHK